MNALHVLKIGTTFPATRAALGDFDRWTCDALGCTGRPLEVIDATQAGRLPRATESAGVVITGSHAMVTDEAPWSEALAAAIRGWLADALPIFGICYGHQLLAHAAGGTVGYHPAGREVGCMRIARLPAADDDPLFADLPSHFAAHCTHAQSVLVLPGDAVRLAANGHDPNHAFRLGPCAWGVQFHPEYDRRIMRDYIIAQSAELQAEGTQVDALLAELQETREACGLLARFAAWADRQSHQ